MSDLKERLERRSDELVRRERVTLPETGVEVQVRGLMLGEVARVGELTGFKRTATTIALATEDPATGRLLWNPAAREDHDRIAKLPVKDSEAIVGAITRLSGLDPAEGNGSSVGSESSDSPSPPDSAEPSTS